MSRRQGAGILARLWDNAKKSSLLGRRPKEVLVGEDEHGNKYFEKADIDQSKSKQLSRMRRVQPRTPDLMEVPDVPVEWMTWLQGRRLNPPTDQERMKNVSYMVRTLERADDLQQQRQAEDSQRDKEIEADVPTQEKEMAFPDYKDLEQMPGQLSKRDKKR